MEVIPERKRGCPARDIPPFTRAAHRAALFRRQSRTPALWAICCRGERAGAEREAVPPPLPPPPEEPEETTVAGTSLEIVWTAPGAAVWTMTEAL